VTSVEPKAARSGPIIVVGITTNLRALDETLLLTERQDIVYRAQDDQLIDQRIDQRNSSTGAALDSSPVEPTRQEPVRQVMRRDDGSWRLQTDPTILMRFSAATSNGHRIHYDWPYATQVEGYPGLVVQGPLTTLALLETLRRDHRDQRVSRVRHRNVAPLFCGDQAVIEIKPSTSGSGSSTTADLVLRRPTGQTITTATATLNIHSERNVDA
jgi:3-methylfumaryl-CoA hydratase